MNVWQIGDGDWWMAPTADEALEAASALYDIPLDDLKDDGIVALSSEDLERLTFYDDLYNRSGDRTFAEEFKRRMASDPTTQIFAVSDY